jgi:hypothetical protein
MSLWPGNWARQTAAVARAAWIGEAQTPDETTNREGADFLAYRDREGRVADFHSLRHRFVTELVRAGVAPKDAKELARHSTITLTMDRYAHVGSRDTAAAVSKLRSKRPHSRRPAPRGAVLRMYHRMYQQEGADGEKRGRVRKCVGYQALTRK